MLQRMVTGSSRGPLFWGPERHAGLSPPRPACTPCFSPLRSTCRKPSRSSPTSCLQHRRRELRTAQAGQPSVHTNSYVQRPAPGEVLARNVRAVQSLPVGPLPRLPTRALASPAVVHERQLRRVVTSLPRRLRGLTARSPSTVVLSPTTPTCPRMRADTLVPHAQVMPSSANTERPIERR